MTSEQDHTDPRSTVMSVFSMLAVPNAGFQSPEAGRANFSLESTSSPRYDGVMTRSRTGSAAASPSDVPKKRVREKVDVKKAVQSLNMSTVQGDRGKKKGIVAGIRGW
jgi:hypothetical protein